MAGNIFHAVLLLLCYSTLRGTYLCLRQVLITVLDINDCRPRFTERVYNTSVFENEPSFTSVITVKAIDLDEGENGVVLYTMLGPRSGMNILMKVR